MHPRMRDRRLLAISRLLTCDKRHGNSEYRGGTASAGGHPRRPQRSHAPQLKAPSMSVNNKRVFYVKYLAHPVYAEMLAARPDVRLDRIENETAEEIVAPILTAAHAYQIGAARDELAGHFHVHAELLQRAPNLLIVSSNGAGYRHRRRRRPAPRQASWWSTRPAATRVGGRARAGHVAQRSRSASRNRSRAAAQSKRQPQFPDRHRGSGQDHRHRRPRQCRHAASRNSARACSACACSPTTLISPQPRWLRAAPRRSSSTI